MTWAEERILKTLNLALNYPGVSRLDLVLLSFILGLVFYSIYSTAGIQYLFRSHTGPGMQSVDKITNSIFNILYGVASGAHCILDMLSFFEIELETIFSGVI